MGGWIALLTALARPSGSPHLVGIAAAPDFTQRLMWEAMTPAERATLERDGVLYVPSQYGEPTPITLRPDPGWRQPSGADGPYPDPTARFACCTARQTRMCPGSWPCVSPNNWRRADVRVILVKDGDHRLSRPSDLALLRPTLPRSSTRMARKPSR